MAKSMKKTVKAVKVEKKVEKPVISESDIIIMPDSPKKAKLEVEMENRVKYLSELYFAFFKRAESGNGLPTLSDCEKMLSASFDCRNTARKLAKVESDIIIA
jgi:hypothetical protein